MSGGRPVPGPGVSGPKQPQLVDKSTWQLSALLGSPPDPPDCPASPRPPPPGGPAEPEPPGEDKTGCRGGGQDVTERRGARAPSARKAATCSRRMEPFFSRAGSLPPRPPPGAPPDGLRAPS
ncbi:unnamed protein product [Pipistrellus nathusii]|uniref:Uncharacterized protein n=1 Tax=Pipistrellus nathusii TaxID=59473 RepID=A0ABP0AHA6_PIPNA